MLLKRDALGRVEASGREGRRVVRRVPCGGRIPGSGILGRILARRERRALERLEGLDGIPRPIGTSEGNFVREFLEGERLDRAGRPPDEYFGRLAGLVGEMHARGVAHNDLAKEANILVLRNGEPALIDFQLAFVRPAPRGRIASALFSTMAREDRRHVLKQKALRRPDLLTPEDRWSLDAPSVPARWWAACVKPVYRLVTRGLLRTADREGRGRRETRRPDPPRAG
ncbi:MAG TPA: serine/threonine protein kinase [Planctomycetota bacterium]|nr:serine/threonine protein kinase [Planctomycetota bacterium]